MTARRCQHCGHTLPEADPHDQQREVEALAQRLRQAGHAVTLAGLVCEAGAAAALGLAVGSLRNRTCYGEPLLQPVLVARRRWYRVADLAKLLHGTA